MSDSKEDGSAGYVINNQGGYVLNEAGERILSRRQTDIPENVLTLDGQPLTLDGQFITLGELPKVNDRLLDAIPFDVVTHEGQIVTHGSEVVTTGRPTDGGVEENSSETATFKSSEWTGRQTKAELRSVVLAAAPVALRGIETLIADLENDRVNDDAALQALRELHKALGELIRDAERGNDFRLQDIMDPVHRFIDASDVALGSVLRSPTMTMGVLAMLGHIFHVDLTTALFSGVVSGFIKKSSP